MKIAESYRSLVRAYSAGTAGKLDDVLTFTKGAWNLADRARQISPSLVDLSTHVESIAAKMANQARQMIRPSLSSSSAK